ncbi:Rpn family recombination-promoting nuclease/putative transposase [Lamprobacter modestohalophilus]|uniref:Rpn family recombination-promoting nuclease/putative transposase n=1 Tax=Lamprobacter modestohalophilus TaxID=1064514 RepID=UPI002ADEEEC9|nr:Rpn family recombination-promoting nuclease/putative transposase [Lamprobacter modestohalophilus]MEA1050901.1 Rpn family recombination-promoting nuclease/putative transposase [Lamprobacter modestohalophilus]
MPRRLISFDWALKRLLRSKAHFGILEGFLSELLQDDIQILEILDSESGRDTPIEKLNRVDLRARNQRGEIILIEVQYQRQFDYLQRILHSSARTLVDHLPKGAPYQDIVKVISVSILYFDFGQGEDYVYHGATRFIGLHRQDELQLSDKQRELYQCDQAHQLFPEYYLIKVNQFDDIASDPLDQWIYFLKNEEIQSDFTARGLQQAKDELDVLKLPEPERRAYERYQDDLHQQASMVQSSYGVGRMQGRKEGREEGHKLGLDEGRRAERERIARSLLDVITDDVILAEKTGLSLDDIQRLRGTQ